MRLGIASPKCSCMMFWGWIWGAIGLVLAIPITAAVKAVCDNVDRLKPYGDWMGES